MMVGKICCRRSSTEKLLYSVIGSLLLLHFIIIYNKLWLGNNKDTTRKPHREISQFELSGTAYLEENNKNISSQPCTVPNDWLYPFCAGKVEWMEQLWHTNKECYLDTHGVNPRDKCSILTYLSEVESFCPILPHRRKLLPTLPHSKRKASIRWDLQGALGLLADPKFLWMRNRITKLWPQWMSGAKTLAKHKQSFQTRNTAKNILVFLGAFAYNPIFFEYAFHGGPLGELVQWSDVITTLHILGHNVTISANLTEISWLLGTPNPPGDCAQKFKPAPFDIIFTDLAGVAYIQLAVGPNFSKFVCLLRVLDSFGTDAEFNYSGYKEEIPGGRSPWGDVDFKSLRQIMTMFPHSPDNSFLGFVVDTSLKKNATTKKPIGLVYGKLEDYFEGKEKYLETLNKYIEIHGTVSLSWGNPMSIPKFVKNHGLVSYARLEELLNEAKVFIGLGFPYEGPAPLEAIAHGCVFLNPKLDPPHDRLNTEFFKEKPTMRKLGSQHPYAEKFIGKPHVWTVNINNTMEVEEAIKHILSIQVKPYLSYEWTTAGMLERVNAYVEKMDFCEHKHRWPPLSERRLQFSGVAQSCTEVCEKNGFLCEPSYFYELNNVESMESSGIKCLTQEIEEAIHAPSYNAYKQSCMLQAQPILFSCVASHPKRMRFCPCRDYQPQQVAFCRNCS